MYSSQPRPVEERREWRSGRQLRLRDAGHLLLLHAIGQRVPSQLVFRRSRWNPAPHAGRRLQEQKLRQQIDKIGEVSRAAAEEGDCDAVV